MIPVDNLAPLAAAELASEATAANARFLILTDVRVSRAGNRVACRVRLTRDAAAFDGEAREPDTELGRARAAARATLAAVEHVSDSASLGLEGLTLVELFHRRYVAVAVDATSGRRFAHLAGLVAIDATRSIEEAAALACLRATERWITA
jgi:hypothetical protein